MTDLRLTNRVAGRRADVTVEGEIDLATSNEFQRYLSTLCDDDLDVVVVDLAECTFMDSTGLRALATACAPLRQPPPALRIGRVSDAVARVLDVSGLASIFEYADAVACPVCGEFGPSTAICANCGSRVG